MAWTAADIPDQTGRTAVVTGANSGLGYETTLALAGAGARVVMACRRVDAAEAAADQVRAAHRDADLEIVHCDLADLAAVRKAADEIAGSHTTVDVVVANAGVMAIPLRRSADGFEMQFGANHLGHFAFVAHLLPTLLSAGAPRVVAVASFAHNFGSISIDDPNWERRRYSRWRAYGQSKLANLLYARELDRRAGDADSALRAMAAHPGYAATNLSSQGPAMTGSSLMAKATQLSDRIFGQSAAMGALPQLYAATAPAAEGGQYYGPDGFAEQRGHPKRARSSAKGKDMEMARRLWVLSEELTGASYDFG